MRLTLILVLNGQEHQNDSKGAICEFLIPFWQNSLYIINVKSDGINEDVKYRSMKLK